MNPDDPGFKIEALVGSLAGVGGLLVYFGLSRGFDFQPLIGQRRDDYRVFAAADGRTMEARVRSVDGGTVRIERRDGQIFDSPIEIFSKADQSFIRKIAESSSNLPVSSPSP